MADGRKRAVVTGAASGIGRAAAERLLREGVDVLAVDLNEPALDGAESHVCDVSDPAARAALAERAGSVDYLVNAAGIIRMTPIWEVTLEEWRQVQAVNVESAFFLCQALGPRMRDGGAIVNLSSTAAKHTTTVEVVSYAASKAAVAATTRVLALALAPRVRVNAICPGIVATPMQDRLIEQVSEQRGVPVEELWVQRTAHLPLKRASTAEETARLVWFLLSDESCYMTGQSVNWSGGWITW